MLGGALLALYGIVLLIASGCSNSDTTVASSLPEQIDFNRDIRPILSNNCYACHGPDLENNKADLRLDLRDAAIASQMLVPGDAGNSEMIARIISDDPDEIMPPPDAHKTLTPEQRELLARWVDEGAEYEVHWSYAPVKRPDAASIDEVIGKKLQRRGLAYSESADPHTLVRRVYLDLLGIPPTPAEVAAFLEDDSGQAYEKLIDRLLQSPHYGERMAVDWLDAVRYADTVGYHGDQARDASPYRDYVINAFNTNKPYDVFTIEQIAGDLLPDAGLEQMVAATYNRLNQISSEGGIQDKEYVKKYQAERVRTTTTAWLGSTLACAECHDHKFDPFTAKDFYSFAAFFSDILEKGAWNGSGRYQVGDVEAYLKEIGFDFDPEKEMYFGPALTVPNRTFMQDTEELDAELERRKERLIAGTPGSHKEFEKWLVERKKLSGLALPANYEISFQPGENQLQPAQSLKNVHRFHFDLKLDKKGVSTKTQVGLLLNFGTEKRLVRWGYKLETNEIQTIQKKEFWIKDKWKPLYFDIKELGIAPDAVLDSITFLNAEDGNAGKKYAIRNARLDTNLYLTPLGQLAPAGRKLLDQYLNQPADEKALNDLRDHYMLSYASSQDLRSIKKHYQVLHEYLNGSRKAPATVSGPFREVRVLNRGSWKDETGEIVQPATPHFLPGAADVAEGEEQQQLTRLDLANWIVSKENPLTARAFVNRVWAKFFGTALSNAPEDLGLQGEYPVYPELLDWLASEFMDSDWDVKHIVKAIVMSDAYRQSSVVSPELMELDPYNRLIARQTPRRLPAELIRDNALAASGLLVTRIGGASVKPYQPDGHYQHLNFPRRSYNEDMNENQYRRGVYMHWQRTFLHPMLVAFDAPGRDECSVSRTQSNTPLQALNLLNDPTFIEAAKAMASRVLQSEEIAQEDAPRIRHAIKLALAREANDEEIKQLQTFLNRERARFQAEPAAADQLLHTGMYQSGFTLDNTELAAWTSLCRAIFNLHETITRY
ncbi:MAG: PSD1 and planctomycete cytochrome C domain-containing protein [Gammaproteobacteria bacterium]|nr:PSD1 and planctomycete cytochrome C domain-containing protein [Gammaproteobacteria bacterium]